MSLLDRAIVKAYREVQRQPAPRPEPLSRPEPEVHSEPVLDAETVVPVIPLPTRKSVESTETVARGWNWPRITQQLLNQSEAGFQHLARQLLGSVTQRQEKCVAFFSSSRGEGCTSVLLTLAHVLARLKQPRVLLVDADFACPTLWSHLQPGQTSTQKKLPAPLERPLMLSGSSVSVLAPVEKVTADLIPEAHQSLAATINSLRDQFDLILIDAGILPAEFDVHRSWMAGTVNAAIAVMSSRQRATSSHEIDEERRWTGAGISWLGMIETFA